MKVLFFVSRLSLALMSLGFVGAFGSYHPYQQQPYYGRGAPPSSMGYAPNAPYQSQGGPGGYGGSFQQPQYPGYPQQQVPSQSYFSQPTYPSSYGTASYSSAPSAQQGYGPQGTVNPAIFIELLKKNYFFGDIAGQKIVDELVSGSAQFRGLLLQSIKSLDLNALANYIKQYRAYLFEQEQQKKLAEQQKMIAQQMQEQEAYSNTSRTLAPALSSEKEEKLVDFGEKEQQPIKPEKQRHKKTKTVALVEEEETAKKESFWFPKTWFYNKQEYPFSPYLTDAGLPRIKNEGSVAGRIYYIAGTEPAAASIRSLQPAWKYIPATLGRDEAGSPIVMLADGEKVAKKLEAMPPIFSPDGKGVARPFLFFSVMGLMEVEFERLIKKYPDFSRFPLLQAIKENDGDSVFKKLPKPITQELEAFPLRSALLGSEFYLVPSSASLKKLAKVDGAVDLVSFDTKAQYDLYRGKGFDKEESRRLAVRDTDIRYLQATHPGAAFQIASNIDCLEGGIEHERLENMQYGAVQGENAVLGTIGAAIIRKYCIDRDERLMLHSSGKGFTGNFSDRYWRIDGAKILPGAKALNADFLSDKSDEILDYVSVGVHKDVAVTSGYYDPVSSAYSKDVQKGAGLKYADWFRKNSVINENRWRGSNQYNFYIYNGVIASELPRVHQIFTAAFDLAHSREYKDLVVKNQAAFAQNYENFAKKLLYAMYRGTIVAAANLKVKELFLTCLGCGAFGNKAFWVKEILELDDMQELIKKSGMKVYVVNYKAPHELN